MVNEGQLDIRIIDTVFDPDKYGVDLSPEVIEKQKPIVSYHKIDDSSLYKVWILLTGPDLPRVDSVTYRLHETFDDPVRMVQRSLSNQDCRITIWTWGIFEIHATILDKAGNTYRLSHWLTYGDVLEKNSRMIQYSEEKPEISSGATLISLAS